PDGIAIHSEGKVAFANPSALRTMGASRAEDLIGRRVIELVHPDYRPAVRARLEALERGEAVPFMEEKLLRLDGTAVEVEGQATPFMYHDKPAVQVVVRDISERKRAEKLQRALYRIAEISGSVQDMPGFYASVHQIVGELMYARNFYLALYDERTRQPSFENSVGEVDAAPAVASISGYSREELHDKSFWDLVHPDFREAVRERALARQRGEAIPSRYEFKVERKDGEERWLDASTSNVEFGGRPAVLGIAFD